MDFTLSQAPQSMKKELRSDKVQHILNLDGKPLKTHESLNFEKECKR